MPTTMTKQQFIELLAAELPESENRSALLANAKKMIPSDFNRSQLTALHNCSSVQRATAAYKALNPDAREHTPSIDRLVAWLADIGGVTYAATLEKKLSATALSCGAFRPFMLATMPCAAITSR